MSVNHTLLRFLERNAKNISILYAEDEEVLQKVTLRYFKKFCPNIDTANNGLEAFELYEKKQSVDFNVEAINSIRDIEEILYS